MFAAGPAYPITLAEMNTYTVDADRLFGSEEHEQLKQFLALHPECGDVIADSGGVRLLVWPLRQSSDRAPMRIVYYFCDLNMPLYLLAIFTEDERIDLTATFRAELTQLVNELVAESNRIRGKVATSLERGA